eukprot:COSAG01_NODE_26343_length_717_cov_0.724919_2_plen_51_part_01
MHAIQGPGPSAESDSWPSGRIAEAKGPPRTNAHEEKNEIHDPIPGQQQPRA